MVDDAESKRARAAKRLRRARIEAGYKTPLEATNKFGWVHRTYLAHENPSKGGRGFKALVDEYAAAFGTTAAYLLVEEAVEISGIPNNTVPIMSLATASELIEIADGKKPQSNKRLAIGPGLQLSKLAFAFEVMGDAMFSREDHDSFKDGDMVFIDPRAPVAAGDFVLAVVNGEKLFRRYRPAVHGSDEAFTLIALNKFYPPIEATKANGARIIGRAMRQLRDL